MRVSPGLLPHLLQWGLLAAGLLVALTLWSERGELPQVGSVVQASIVLNTTDRTRLSCAFEASVNGYRCEFSQPGWKWPEPAQPPEAERLAPYVTTRRAVLLVPGLFGIPEVERHYEQERKRVKGHESRKRFEVDCEFELVRKLDDVGVRFRPRAKWGTESGIWVAAPQRCQVFEVSEKR